MEVRGAGRRPKRASRIPPATVVFHTFVHTRTRGPSTTLERGYSRIALVLHSTADAQPLFDFHIEWGDRSATKRNASVAPCALHMASKLTACVCATRCRAAAQTSSWRYTPLGCSRRKACRERLTERTEVDSASDEPCGTGEEQHVSYVCSGPPVISPHGLPSINLNGPASVVWEQVPVPLGAQQLGSASPLARHAVRMEPMQLSAVPGDGGGNGGG